MIYALARDIPHYSLLRVVCQLISLENRGKTRLTRRGGGGGRRDKRPAAAHYKQQECACGIVNDLIARCRLKLLRP